MRVSDWKILKIHCKTLNNTFSAELHFSSKTEKYSIRLAEAYFLGIQAEVCVNSLLYNGIFHGLPGNIAMT